MKNIHFFSSWVRRTSFVFLYGGVPALLAYLPAWLQRYYGVRLNWWVVPTLLLTALCVYVPAARRGELRLRDFVQVAGVSRRDWGWLALRFLVLAGVLTLGLLLRKPEALLAFPRGAPLTWLVVLIFYPLLSVLPQGLLYRWLYERSFAGLFRSDRAQLLAGALVFSWAHIIFHNAYALLFTFIGGLLFLSGYRRTKSMLFSNLEHALFGDFLFTIGWGVYFFEGSPA